MEFPLTLTLLAGAGREVAASNPCLRSGPDGSWERMRSHVCVCWNPESHRGALKHSGRTNHHHHHRNQALFTLAKSLAAASYAQREGQIDCPCSFPLPCPYMPAVPYLSNLLSRYRRVPAPLKKNRKSTEDTQGVTIS